MNLKTLDRKSFKASIFPINLCTSGVDTIAPINIASKISLFIKKLSGRNINFGVVKSKNNLFKNANA